jgi:hypothetical protein
MRRSSASWHVDRAVEVDRVAEKIVNHAEFR